MLIVGAGISGIGAAYYLQQHHPQRSYAILEARGGIGGTWDLFRYPGIRSDSDLHTFGYEFKPWRGDYAIADGAEILDYLREAARENLIDQKIRYRPQGAGADWSSEDARWVDRRAPRDTGEPGQITCSWLFIATRLLPLRRRIHPGTRRDSSGSRARSCTRSTGRRTSTTPTRRSS